MNIYASKNVKNGYMASKNFLWIVSCFKNIIKIKITMVAFTN